MKIKMLQTVNGKVNGVKMGPFTEGMEYDLDTKQAELFIGSAMAEAVAEAIVVPSELNNEIEVAIRPARRRLLGV